jgi:hypothetical protein
MKSYFFLIFLTCLFAGCAEATLENTCNIPATVRDLSGFDGCGFVFELEDGRRIEPVMIMRCGTSAEAEREANPLLYFEFVDGKKVRLSYKETGRPSICMVGPVVEIMCIEEVTEGYPEE